MNVNPGDGIIHFEERCCRHDHSDARGILETVTGVPR